jgi:ribonuclease HIII
MNNTPNVFVTTLDPSRAAEVKNFLQSEGFSLSIPPYSLISGKKKGISLTFYSSGKLVVQGKDMAEFIQFKLEPELLHTFTFGYEAAMTEYDYTPHLGLDESGKGDYFGPLCVAAVYGDENIIKQFVKMGVTDSKKLSDKRALQLTKEIQKIAPYEVMRLPPSTYNKLYEKFQNLNTLLAWAHHKVLIALQAKTNAQHATVDQFAKKAVLDNFIQRAKCVITLKQMPRAEADPVVAAASIVARGSFLQGLEEMSKTFSLPFPKGASSKTIDIGKEFIRQHGLSQLSEVGKMHFQTTVKLIEHHSE